MRALVTGANGALGPSLISLLIEKGWDVHALVYQLNQDVVDRTSAKVFIGDITSLESMRQAFQGVDVVFHLAALLHIQDPTKELSEAYYSTNVIGTENVIACAQETTVQRVVFFSTIAVYGEQTTSEITEAALPRPDTYYARTKLEAEEIVLSARRIDGKSLGVVLRLGAVYGARVKGNYRLLFHSLSKGSFIPIGRGQNRRTLVYDQDVAQAAYLAATHPQAQGCTFNVTDGQYHTIDDIIQSICVALGRNPPRWHLPTKLIEVMAELSEKIFRIVGRQAPIRRATIAKYLEDIAVDGQLIQDNLGFSPKYDLAAGWNETVVKLRESEDL